LLLLLFWLWLWFAARGALCVGLSFYTAALLAFLFWLIFTARHLLPLNDSVHKFVDNYAQLYRTVYSTMHNLPVRLLFSVDFARFLRH
jgi:hypothetical protein